MPRRKSVPPDDLQPPSNLTNTSGVTKQRRGQGTGKIKRSYNFQKIVDKVNRENRKFITSSQEPKKVSVQGEKNMLGTKYQRMKKSLDMNVEKLGSIESMILKIKSDIERSGKIEVEVQELLLMFERILSVSSDTRSKVSSIDEYLRQCMEQVEQVNKDFENIKNEHISFIQGLIRFVDVDWMEERQFD